MGTYYITCFIEYTLTHKQTLGAEKHEKKTNLGEDIRINLNLKFIIKLLLLNKNKYYLLLKWYMYFRKLIVSVII